MADEIDLTLKVPVELILREYECPICFELLDDAYLTKCGHYFCKGCIQECLNLKHECPTCKSETTIEEAVKDFHSDMVIKLLVTEKEKASKNYYEGVLGDVI